MDSGTKKKWKIVVSAYWIRDNMIGSIPLPLLSVPSQFSYLALKPLLQFLSAKHVLMNVLCQIDYFIHVTIITNPAMTAKKSDDGHTIEKIKPNLWACQLPLFAEDAHVWDGTPIC
jgi:hypothetical protein